MLKEYNMFESTKVIELGSCAFRQWKADSHCKFLHGYQLKAKFWFTADVLDERNWVVDFGALKGLEAKLKLQFDHTVCLDSKDPLLEEFKRLNDAGGCDLRIMDGVGIEKTAEWCFNTAKEFIGDLTFNRCKVSKFEVWEHERNSATYAKEYVVS
jgi:6-pyruvoyltetrahydropterin/6-carboxytetrahydropterin synthase